jgi:branched-chain amino acid transport system ATP-binding protein
VPDALLSLLKVTKRYGGLVVLNDVSLSVGMGEIHAVIGPNGAGKSTLMGLISGMIAADSGSILLDGRDVGAFSVVRRARLGVGRCFQVPSVIPGFSVRDNVALAVQAVSGSSFRFLRSAASEKVLNTRADELLAQVGLTGRGGAAAATLSHGELRQLEMAVALAAEPRLLLLDEPLAGAGPEETDRLVRLLGRLRDRFAILLVEHDMQAVFALADRISVLVQGRLIVTGDEATIRSHPDVQAAYLGEESC